MKNISFDNPYWLLIAIPLIAAVLIPYFISVSKDNRTKGWIASLVIHMLIIISVALAAAGLIHTTVMTRTKIYVVADVSYSSNKNLDQIDEYVRQIEENLPPNCMMGVVCFGKDAQIVTSAGTEVKSVKEATVDTSATDIVKALEFTDRLFGEGEIKRIILITDGFVTTNNGSVAATVNRIASKGVKIDAIYLDNNLKEGDKEIQLSDVEYTNSTYLDHESTLKMLIESSVDNDVIAHLSVKGKNDEDYTNVDTVVTEVGIGMNILTIPLPTDVSGTFDYKVEISARYDTSPYNNTYYFTQTVVGQRSILLVTGNSSDIAAISALYGETAKIDAYLVRGANSSIPYTIEELVKYDEIILSNVDIRDINHIRAFINAADLAVSQYGKSLITLGDLNMQNQSDERFDMLEELLPVNFGNANKDLSLYTIILDISRSMNDTSQLIVAKDAALKLLSILDDDDYIAYITLAGEARIEQTPTRLGDVRQELYEKIQGAVPVQGTFIGEALDMAYNHMKDLNFGQKQVMLISDGLTFTYEPESAEDVAQKMIDNGITLSTVNVIREDDEGFLKNLAFVGGGKYYFIKNESMVSELVFAEIAGDLTEAVIEKQTAVNIETYRDGTVDGIISLPDIYGYVNSKPKLDATMVLSVDYQKNAITTVTVPLYSYREHGNGRVASFTSSLSGDWLSGWSDEVKSQLFNNILVTNTPAEYINYPFNVFVETEFGRTNIEIIPSSVNPRATAKIKLTTPDGKIATADMSFDQNRYYVNMSTPKNGKYRVEITYTYGSHSFKSSTYFTIQYGSEYDAFAAYDIVKIYDFMRGIGRIERDGNFSLENNKNEVDTYELSFRVPLLIAAAALFVIDVIVRKFRWRDLKGLFAKKRKEGASK